MPRPCLPHQKPCRLCGQPIEFVGRIPVQPGHLGVLPHGEGKRVEVITDAGEMVVGAARFDDAAYGVGVIWGRYHHRLWCPSPKNRGRHRPDYMGPRDWVPRSPDRQTNLI